MDRNRLAGRIRQIKGKMKEAVGKAAGDASTRLEGRFEQATGKVQEAYGRAKDEGRAIAKQREERLRKRDCDCDE